MTKEEIYDEEINPLMAQIIAIAKANEIAMLASFKISDEDDDDYEDQGPTYCTTFLPGNSRVLDAALGVISGRYMPVPATMAMMLKLDDATTEKGLIDDAARLSE